MWNFLFERIWLCFPSAGPVGEGNSDFFVEDFLEVKRFESTSLKVLLTSSLELHWTLNR